VGGESNKDVNSNVIKYFLSLIREKNIKGITNITPSYNKLIVSFDLNLTSFLELKEKIINIKLTNILDIKVKKIKIPVCCDDEFALDIERLTKKLNLSKKAILDKYFDKEYFCYMTGFIAGMPFMGDVDERIQLNRLETPRLKVPKGSVGITEQFSNIYTFESPGGWNIIGNTPIKVFDKLNLGKPTLINPGDKVLFYEISKKEFLNLNNE
jgi:Allophanate hydrolase subunit 1